jgi:hypothetical protein
MPASYGWLLNLLESTPRINRFPMAYIFHDRYVSPIYYAGIVVEELECNEPLLKAAASCGKRRCQHILCSAESEFLERGSPYLQGRV